jgi:hypothetical protein
VRALAADVASPWRQRSRRRPKYLATLGGPASYDPLACCLTRRTVMYRERDAEASF